MAGRNRGSGYIRNIGRSMNYSMQEALSQRNPAVSGFITGNTEFFQDIRNTLRDLRKGQARLRSAMFWLNEEDQDDVVKALGKFADRSIKQIKTGDWTKSEEEEMADFMGDDMADMMKEMDSEDFGFDEDDDEMKDLLSDMKKDVGGATTKLEKTTAEVGAAQVGALKENTKAVIASGTHTANAISVLDKHINQQTSALMSGMSAANKVRSNIAVNQAKLAQVLHSQQLQALDTLNTNVSNLVEFHNGIMGKFAEESSQYYKDSLDELRKISGALLRAYPEKPEAVDRTTLYDKLGLGSDRILDLKQFFKMSGQNFLNNTDIGNMISMIDPMMINMFLGKGVMGLAFDALINKVVPEVLDKYMERFNRTLVTFVPAMLGKLAQQAETTTNFWLQNLGEIFGIRHGATEKNLSDYNKKAVPFDGITHKTINHVIPRYLSEIVRLLGGENVMFNHERGRFENIENMKQSIEAERRQDAQSAYGYNAMAGLNEEINKMRIDAKGTPDEQKKYIKETRQKFRDAFEDILQEIARSGQSYVNIHDPYELMRIINNGNIDNKMLITFSKMVKRLPPEEQMRIVSSALAYSSNRQNRFSYEREGDYRYNFVNDNFGEKARKPVKKSYEQIYQDMEDAKKLGYMDIFNAAIDPKKRKELKERFERERKRKRQEEEESTFLSEEKSKGGVASLSNNFTKIEDYLDKAVRALYTIEYNTSILKDLNGGYDYNNPTHRGYLKQWDRQVAGLGTPSAGVSRSATTGTGTQTGLRRSPIEFYRRQSEESEANDQEKTRFGLTKSELEMVDAELKERGSAAYDATELASIINDVATERTDEEVEAIVEAMMEAQEMEAEENKEDMEDIRRQNEEDKETFFSRMWRILQSPMTALSSAFDAMDKTLYAMIFGDPNNKNKGMMDAIVQSLKDGFNSVIKTLKQEFWEPIKRMLFNDFQNGGLYRLVADSLRGVRERLFGRDENAPDYEGMTEEEAAQARAEYEKQKEEERLAAEEEEKANRIQLPTEEARENAERTANRIRAQAERQTQAAQQRREEEEEDWLENNAFAYGRKGTFWNPFHFAAGDNNKIWVWDSEKKKYVKHQKHKYLDKNGQLQQQRVGTTGYYRDSQGRWVVLSGGESEIVPAHDSAAGLRADKKKEDNVVKRMYESAVASGNTAVVEALKNITQLNEAQLEELSKSTDLQEEQLEETKGKKKSKKAKTYKDYASEELDSIFRHVASYLFGEDKDENGNIKPVVEQVRDVFAKGAIKFNNIFFGSEEVQSPEMVKDYSIAIKNAIPRGIGKGLVYGTGIGLLSASGGLGVLGSIFLPGGPIGAAIVGLGVGLASENSHFMEWLFGKKNEETGQYEKGKMSGIANFFEKNKTTILGGTAVGILQGLTGHSLIQSVAGLVPGGGMLAGLGMGILGPVVVTTGIALGLRSKAFEKLMFGEADPSSKDGERIGGLLNRGIGKDIHKHLPNIAVGAAVGGAGSLVMGQMGILGTLALSPYAGAIAGGVIGFGMASKRFQEALFGKQDEDGNFVSGGLADRLSNFIEHELFNPFKSFMQTELVRSKIWFYKSVMTPIVDAMAPIKIMFKTLFDDVKKRVSDAISRVAKKIEDILGPIAGMIRRAVVGMINGIRGAVGGTLHTILSFARALLSAPIKLLTLPANMLGTYYRHKGTRTQQRMMAEADKEKEARHARVSEYEKAQLAELEEAVSTRDAERVLARSRGYDLDAKQLAAKNKRWQMLKEFKNETIDILTDVRDYLEYLAFGTLPPGKTANDVEQTGEEIEGYLASQLGSLETRDDIIGAQYKAFDQIVKLRELAKTNPGIAKMLKTYGLDAESISDDQLLEKYSNQESQIKSMSDIDFEQYKTYSSANLKVSGSAVFKDMLAGKYGPEMQEQAAGELKSYIDQQKAKEESEQEYDLKKALKLTGAKVGDADELNADTSEGRATAIREREAAEEKEKQRLSVFGGMNNKLEQLVNYFCGDGKKKSLWDRIKGFFSGLLGAAGLLGSLMNIGGWVLAAGVGIEKIYNWVKNHWPFGGGDGSGDNGEDTYSEDQKTSHVVNFMTRQGIRAFGKTRIGRRAMGKGLSYAGRKVGGAIERGLEYGSRLGENMGEAGLRMQGKGVANAIEQNADEVFDLGEALRRSGGRAGTEAAESGIERSGANVGKEVAEKESGKLLRVVKEYFGKGLESISKSERLKKFMGVSAVETVCGYLKNAAKNINKGFISRWGKRIAKEIFRQTGRTVADLATEGIAIAVFAAYDAARGFSDASQMWGVNAEDCTLDMRKAAAAYNAIASLPGVWMVDLVLEFAYPEGKRALLMMLYNAMGYGGQEDINAMQQKALKDFEEWNKLEGNSDKSFEQYLADSQKDYTPILDAIRDQGLVGELLAGRKNENGELSSHGILTAANATWDETQWYEMPMIAPRMILGTTRKYLFGDVSDGRFIPGITADSRLGQVINNLIVGLFGEAATETYEGSEGAIGAWFRKFGNMWDKGVFSTIEEWQEQAQMELKEHGYLHGWFNIIAKGFFGAEWDTDPLTKMQDALANTLRELKSIFTDLGTKIKNWYANLSIKDMMKEFFFGEEKNKNTINEVKNAGAGGNLGSSNEIELEGVLDTSDWDTGQSASQEANARKQQLYEFSQPGRWEKAYTDYKNSLNPGETALTFKEFYTREMDAKYKELGLFRGPNGKGVFTRDEYIGKFGEDPAAGGTGGGVSQKDPRIAKIPLVHGKSSLGTIGDSGCSLVATENALKNVGIHTNINTMRSMLSSSDFAADGSGITPAYIQKAVNSSGGMYLPIDPTNEAGIKKAMDAGMTLIAGGKYSSADGHYITLKGHEMQDPNKRGTRQVTINDVMKGLQGGPQSIGVIANKMSLRQPRKITGYRNAAEAAWFGKQMGGRGNGPISSEKLDPGAPQTLPFYKQDDDRWGDKEYPYSDGRTGDSFAASACGPTTMAMLLSWATGKTFTPEDTAAWFSSRGYHDNGTNWYGLPVLAQENGFDLKESDDLDEIERALKSGTPVIGGQKAPSEFTGGQHYVLYAGARDDGSWIVYDPNRRQPNEGFTRSEIAEGWDGAYIPVGSGFGKGPNAGEVGSGGYRGSGSGGSAVGASLFQKISGELTDIGRAYYESILTGESLTSVYARIQKGNGGSTPSASSGGAVSNVGPAPGKGAENIPSTAPKFTIPMAERASKISGIPADWIWAQWANESGENFDAGVAGSGLHNYAGLTVTPDMPGEQDGSMRWGKWNSDEEFADYFGKYITKWDDPASTSAKTMYEYVNNIQNQSDGSAYCTDPPGTEQYYNAMVSRLGNTGTDLRKGGTGSIRKLRDQINLYNRINGVGGKGPDISASRDGIYGAGSKFLAEATSSETLALIDTLKQLDVHDELNTLINILQASSNNQVTLNDNLIKTMRSMGSSSDGGGRGNGQSAAPGMKLQKIEAPTPETPPNADDQKKGNSGGNEYSTIHQKNMEIAKGGKFAAA